ncbi:hypothetical protein EYC80_005145 [Monilinia laxa]|uniref:Uncharacterized protein n=1 Tax=Monilinia laxa TaxID=61186 RepID=A0A5N6KJB0_MONLA|nr:hypothetical protein EYC80_005145 [Monilinia laxa]
MASMYHALPCFAYHAHYILETQSRSRNTDCMPKKRKKERKKRKTPPIHSPFRIPILFFLISIPPFPSPFHPIAHDETPSPCMHVYDTMTPPPSLMKSVHAANIPHMQRFEHRLLKSQLWSLERILFPSSQL